MAIPSREIYTIQFPDSEVPTNTFLIADTNLHMVFVGNASIVVQVVTFPERSNHGVIGRQIRVHANLVRIFQHSAVQRSHKVGAALVLKAVDWKLFAFRFGQGSEHLVSGSHFHQAGVVQQVQAIAQFNNRTYDIGIPDLSPRNFFMPFCGASKLETPLRTCFPEIYAMPEPVVVVPTEFEMLDMACSMCLTNTVRTTNDALATAMCVIFGRV